MEGSRGSEKYDPWVTQGWQTCNESALLSGKKAVPTEQDYRPATIIDLAAAQGLGEDAVSKTEKLIPSGQAYLDTVPPGLVRWMLKLATYMAEKSDEADWNTPRRCNVTTRAQKQKLNGAEDHAAEEPEPESEPELGLVSYEEPKDLPHQLDVTGDDYEEDRLADRDDPWEDEALTRSLMLVSNGIPHHELGLPEEDKRRVMRRMGSYRWEEGKLWRVIDTPSGKAYRIVPRVEKMRTDSTF